MDFGTFWLRPIASSHRKPFSSESHLNLECSVGAGGFNVVEDTMFGGLTAFACYWQNTFRNFSPEVTEVPSGLTGRVLATLRDYLDGGRVILGLSASMSHWLATSTRRLWCPRKSTPR